MHGSGVESLDEAKRQFQVARDKWFEWADLSERQRANVSFHCWFRLALAGRFSHSLRLSSCRKSAILRAASAVLVSCSDSTAARNLLGRHAR